MTAWLRRLRARIKYRNYARDLERELEVHREMATRDLAGAGTPDQIRRAAALQLGNTTLIREDVRAMWLPKLLQELMQDARYAGRSFRREWRFTIAAIALLSLGLGVTVGGFVLLNGLFLRGWPVPDAGAVFRVKPVLPPSAGRIDDGLSFGAYQHISASAKSAEYVAMGSAYVRISTARDERFPGSVPVGIYVSDNFFNVLQIPLQMGTPPRPGPQGLEPTVVIADHVWRSIFQSDPNVIGRQAWLDGKPVTIAGVTAGEFTGLDRAAGVYVPLWAAPQMSARGSIQDAVANPQACCVSVAGRRRPGVGADAIAAELQALAGQYRSSIGRPALSLELGSTSSGDLVLSRGLVPALALAGPGAFALLLLTCANVANLYLARSLRRQHEITTRLAIGAGRGRLIRQLLTEGLVLAALAGVVVLGAAAAVPSMIVASGGDVSAARFGVDLPVALATLGAVLFVCLVVSLAPALRATRVIWRGGAAMATARTGGLRGVLLGVQVALATVLVLSATLITRGIQHGLTQPMGFAVDTTTAGQVLWPSDTTPGTAKRAALQTSLLAASSPTAPIGLVSSVPASSRPGLSTSVRQPNVEVDFSISLFPMSTSAAEVLNLRLVTGRWSSDDPRNREAVVNETLARLIWSNGTALGRTLSLDFNDTDFVIVGVARDAHLRGPRDIEPMMHIAPHTGAMHILTARSTEAENTIRAILKNLEPTATIRFTPLSESIHATMATARGGAIIAGGLGVVALLLAMIGVYGVFSYLVEERRREIGIRLALGAGKREIRQTVFRATRWALVGGLAGGLVLSAIAGLGLQRFLFGLSPADPLSYLALGVILVGTAMLATMGPIRRATRVDPAITLRAS
jgi:predicted permease